MWEKNFKYFLNVDKGISWWSLGPERYYCTLQKANMLCDKIILVIAGNNLAGVSRGNYCISEPEKHITLHSGGNEWTQSNEIYDW